MKLRQAVELIDYVPCYRPTPERDVIAFAQWQCKHTVDGRQTEPQAFASSALLPSSTGPLSRGYRAHVECDTRLEIFWRQLKPEFDAPDVGVTLQSEFEGIKVGSPPIFTQRWFSHTTARARGCGDRSPHQQAANACAGVPADRRCGRAELCTQFEVDLRVDRLVRWNTIPT